MRAIETRYLGPTNYRGSRVRVGWADREGKTLTVAWNDALNVDENHAAAARAFKERCTTLTDACQLVGGSTARGFVFVLLYKEEARLALAAMRKHAGTRRVVEAGGAA